MQQSVGLGYSTNSACFRNEYTGARHFPFDILCATNGFGRISCSLREAIGTLAEVRDTPG